MPPGDSTASDIHNLPKLLTDLATRGAGRAQRLNSRGVTILSYTPSSLLESDAIYFDVVMDIMSRL